jgi:hypothetical protein
MMIVERDRAGASAMNVVKDLVVGAVVVGMTLQARHFLFSGFEHIAQAGTGCHLKPKI